MSNASDSPRPAGWYARFRPHVACLLGLVLLAAMGGFAYWKISRPMYRYQLGLDALAQHDPVMLSFASQALANTKGFEPHAHLLQGAAILKIGAIDGNMSRLSEATEHFTKCSRNAETRVPALLMTGECYAKANRNDIAEKCLSEVLLIDPNQVDAHRLLAQIYFDVGVMNKAMFHLTQVAKLDTEDCRAVQFLGRIQADFGDFEGAITSYDEALARGPSEADERAIRFELAQSLVKRRNYARALKVLGTWLPPKDYRPTDGSAAAPDYLAMKAECQLGLGDRDEAKKSLAEALQIQPEHLASLLLAGNIALQSQDPKSAESLLKRALQTNPKDYTANFRLEQAYRQMGDKERADEQHEVVQMIQSLKEKFAELHQAAMKQPENAEIRYQLGVTAQDLNDPEMAVSWFNAAVSIDPNHTKALQALNAASK